MESIRWLLAVAGVEVCKKKKYFSLLDTTLSKNMLLLTIMIFAIIVRRGVSDDQRAIPKTGEW